MTSVITSSRLVVNKLIIMPAILSYEMKRRVEAITISVMSLNEKFCALAAANNQRQMIMKVERNIELCQVFLRSTKLLCGIVPESWLMCWKFCNFEFAAGGDFNKL